MAKVKAEVIVKEKVYNAEVEIDESKPNEVTFEWIPEGMEGGPVMRPKEAPSK